MAALTPHVFTCEKDPFVHKIQLSHGFCYANSINRYDTSESIEWNDKWDTEFKMGKMDERECRLDWVHGVILELDTLK